MVFLRRLMQEYNDGQRKAKDFEVMHKKRFSLIVSGSESGVRVDRWLAARVESTGISRARVQELIRSDCLFHAGAPQSDVDRKVRTGEHFVFEVPPLRAGDLASEDVPLRILFEDGDLVVIDKPAGLVVHPPPGHTGGSLVNALLGHCGPMLRLVGPASRPGIVHRLDKDTSGVLVACKSEKARLRLVADFAARRVERAYHAFVRGVPAPPAGRISASLARHPRHRLRMRVVRHGGKPSITRYQVVCRYGGVASRLLCRLETGRTHQIRVHLAWAGHPLVGDPMYARNGFSGFARQALHAFRLGFCHPVTGRSLRFETPLPSDMLCLEKRLQRAEPDPSGIA